MTIKFFDLLYNMYTQFLVKYISRNMKLQGIYVQILSSRLTQLKKKNF